MPPKQKSLTVNAIMNGINQISGVLFPLIAFPYISRTLQPEGLGKVNFAQAIISYFILAGSMGLTLYGMRSVAKVRDDKRSLSQLVAELFTINCAMTLFAFVSFLVFMSCSTKAASDPMLFWICIIPLLFAPLGIQYVFQGLEEFAFVTGRTLLVRVLSLIAMFVFIKDSGDYRIFALISAISILGSSFINVFFAHKFLSLRLINIRKLRIRAHLRPIFFMALTGVANTIYVTADKVMLGFMSTNDEVGYYAVAQKMVVVIVSFLGSIVGVLAPRASYYIHTGNLEMHRRMTKLSFSLMLSLAFLSTGAFLLLAKPVVLLLAGEQYINSVPMAMVSAGSIMAIVFYNFILYQVIYPMGHDRAVFISLGVGVLVNISFNYFLIPEFNGLGASLATLLSQMAVSLVVVVYLMKYASDLLVVLMRPFLIGLACSGLILGAIFFLKKLLIYHEITVSIGCVGVYVLGYLLFLYVRRDEGLIFIFKKVAGRFL